MMGGGVESDLSFLHRPSPVPCTPRPASTTDWLGRMGRISVYSVWAGGEGGLDTPLVEGGCLAYILYTHPQLGFYIEY